MRENAAGLFDLDQVKASGSIFSRNRHLGSNIGRNNVFSIDTFLSLLDAVNFFMAVFNL